jgi:hypothetical protein
MNQPVGGGDSQTAEPPMPISVTSPTKATAEVIQASHQPDLTHPIALGSRGPDQDVILAAIDKFIELRRSEWGQVPSQKGEFNPQVTRYDMLQKFRKAVERGELGLFTFPEAISLAEQIFLGWRHLARQAVPADHYWGHPIPLPTLYGHLPRMTWAEFLDQLHQLQSPTMELVPSRLKNWPVGDRLVGAITFHADQSPKAQ